MTKILTETKAAVVSQSFSGALVTWCWCNEDFYQALYASLQIVNKIQLSNHLTFLRLTQTATGK